MPRYSIPEGAAEPRAADPIPGGPQCPPLHPFAHKEPRRFDHRLGGAARTTLIAAPPLNPVDQAGHQTACRSSPRPSPVSIAQESWAHAPSLAAAVAAESTLSTAHRTFENRALKSFLINSKTENPALIRHLRQYGDAVVLVCQPVESEAAASSGVQQLDPGHVIDAAQDATAILPAANFG